MLLFTAVLGLVAVQSTLAFESKFNKPIDLHELGKEWKDGDSEDEEWHEDTYEWREKDRARKKVEFDASNPSAFLANAMAGGGMEMNFVTLKEHWKKRSKERTDMLGSRWKSLLQTDGIRVTIYTINPGQLLITHEEGQILRIKDFVLSQPEVKTFRWKNDDHSAADYMAGRKKFIKREEDKKAQERAARLAKHKAFLEAQKKKKAAKKAAKKGSKKEGKTGDL